MCGIGGFVDYERDARRGGPILHGMKRTLTPRGPDAEGTYFDEDAALVHRRLIVIDPEGGKQPMHSPDRNTIIIYNGELYNTPELRTELMSRGHEFVGHSDTEVLLHAYLEWKTDAFAAERHFRLCYLGETRTPTDALPRPARRETAVFRSHATV